MESLLDTLLQELRVQMAAQTAYLLEDCEGFKDLLQRAKAKPSLDADDWVHIEYRFDRILKGMVALLPQPKGEAQ